jgi:O-antigen ligase
MWREDPVLGVRLDTFGPFWHTQRSAESVQALGAERFPDAADSVPLQLLATGGLVLALAYLAFVVLAAAGLVGGLRRLRGEERLLLGRWAAAGLPTRCSPWSRSTRCR